MPCGATQDGRVMVERSDRMWSTGEGNGKPLQYSCFENPMNSMGGLACCDSWGCKGLDMTERLNWTELNWMQDINNWVNCEGNFPGSSVVKTPPAAKETHVWFLNRKIPWRRKWQPTPVILPGKFHGQRGLAGYSPWGGKDPTWLSD